MQTIQLEKKLCENCVLWSPLTREEQRKLEYPANECWGICQHWPHKTRDDFVCKFPNLFCQIDDFNCETCSREECPLHRQGKRNNGCVKDWRHQSARYKV